MHGRATARLLGGMIAALLACTAARADLLPVDHPEGSSHSFLTLTDLDGTSLADGEVTQVADTDKVTGHLVFKFKDGSLYDDTAVWSQRGRFRLLSDHRIEQGPAFKRSLETLVDLSTGSIDVHYESGGKPRTITVHRKLPEDLANGIFIMLLNHIPPRVKQTTVSFLATVPEPHAVKMIFSRGIDELVHHGEIATKVTPYVVHVKIPGMAGALASVAGKQPRDMKVWVTDGPAPTFVRFEGALYVGGPDWRIAMRPATVAAGASVKP